MVLDTIIKIKLKTDLLYIQKFLITKIVLNKIGM